MKGFTSLLMVAALCTGCSTLVGNYNSGLLDSKSTDLVITDLMTVMDQLLDPAATTVQYRKVDSHMANELESYIRKSGYAVQKVDQDQGANFLNFLEAVETTATGTKQYKFTILIGGVLVERSYEKLRGVGLYPASPVVVRGSKKIAKLNSNLFSLKAEDVTALNRVEYSDLEDIAIRIPKVTLITEQLVSELVSSEADLPNELGFNASNMETYNVFFTNESNFSEITNGYRLVRRDVVAFGDDSLRLGPKGKKMVKKIFANFNKDTDIISLLGCSNGVTKSPLGNEGLALGRAKRVLEEFQSLGVARTSLLDEGCWAPNALTGRYPGRGVVVELKRRKS